MRVAARQCPEGGPRAEQLGIGHRRTKAGGQIGRQPRARIGAGTIDRARELTAMLTAIRFEELTDAGGQIVHSTIARIVEHFDRVKELAAG